MRLHSSSRVRELTAATLIVVSALLSGTASADDGATICTGDLSGSLGDVVVPAGASCNLHDATVTGNVTAIGASGRVDLTFVNVSGNIDIKSFTGYAVTMYGVRAGRNVNVSDSSASWGIAIEGNPGGPVSAGGNVTFTGNTGMVGRVNGWRVGGNLVINGNSFFGNALAVHSNAVGKNLTFIGNSGTLWFGGWFAPGDTQLYPNSAGGNMVCRNNSGFRTGGTNTARKVIGCNSPLQAARDPDQGDGERSEDER